MAVFELTKGVLEMPADTREFGGNLSDFGVLRPLRRAVRFNIFDLRAKQQQSFRMTNGFLQDCGETDKLAFICSERYFAILKSQHYIRITECDQACQPSVIWKYWLEPAELSIKIDVLFDALMINSIGEASDQDAVLTGLLKIIIRTEFKLCMVQVEYYPSHLWIRDNNTVPESEAKILYKDKENLMEHIWREWIPNFVNEVNRVVATWDFCDKWLPLNYYSIIKY